MACSSSAITLRWRKLNDPRFGRYTAVGAARFAQVSWAQQPASLAEVAIRQSAQMRLAARKLPGCGKLCVLLQQARQCADDALRQAELCACDALDHRLCA